MNSRTWNELSFSNCVYADVREDICQQDGGRFDMNPRSLRGWFSWALHWAESHADADAWDHKERLLCIKLFYRNWHCLILFHTSIWKPNAPHNCEYSRLVLQQKTTCKCNTRNTKISLTLIWHSNDSISSEFYCCVINWNMIIINYSPS